MKNRKLFITTITTAAAVGKIFLPIETKVESDKNLITVKKYNIPVENIMEIEEQAIFQEYSDNQYSLDLAAKERSALTAARLIGFSKFRRSVH